MAKKKRLGRGLDALLSKPVAQTAAVSGSPQPKQAEGLLNIPVDLLQRGQYQPRVDMRQDTTGTTQRYEIVAGERRWRAAQLAGLQEIPAVVRDVPDDAAIAMALIENIQRENLNPLEESRALDRLIREFDLTHQEAAEAVGRSRASVSNLLRLQDLSDKVKPLLESRQLEMGHARALLAITNKTQQYDAARQVVNRGMSVRDTEKLVRRMQSGDANKSGKSSKTSADGDIKRLEKDISDKLGAKVRIDHSKSGNGKLIIAYNSLDELDGILKHIK
jgi:ParB family chromosome partitioning protein